jgi:hypothetical protein
LIDNPFSWKDLTREIGFSSGDGLYSWRKNTSLLEDFTSGERLYFWRKTSLQLKDLALGERS